MYAVNGPGDLQMIASAAVSNSMFALSLYPGTYRLRTSLNDIYDPNTDGQEDDVVVAAMGESIGALTLVRQAPLCDLYGHVTCGGQAAPGATVTIWDAGDCLKAQRRTQTDKNGDYCFSGIPSGSYKVIAYKRGTACCTTCLGAYDTNSDGVADAVTVTTGNAVKADATMTAQSVDVVSVALTGPGGAKVAGAIALVGQACRTDAPMDAYCFTSDANGVLEFPLQCGVPYGGVFFWKDNNRNASLDTGDYLGFLDIDGDGAAEVPDDCLNMTCMELGQITMGVVK